MRPVILYGAPHLLFAAALAVDPNINLLRVHEHIELNRHIMHDNEDGSDQLPQPSGCPIQTSFTSLTLVPTTAPTLATCTASPDPSIDSSACTTIYYDDEYDEDDFGEGDELYETTIWQTVTSTATDTIDDGSDDSCAPTPPCAVTYVPPPVLTQSCSPYPPPSPVISTTWLPAPPPIVTTVWATAPAQCDNVVAPPASTIITTVTAALDGGCSPNPAPVSAPTPPTCAAYNDESDDEETAPPASPNCGCDPSVNDYEHQYGDDTVDWVLDTKDHTRRRVERAKDRADRGLSHIRPSHIHDRIGQVLHDERPLRSEEHVEFHERHGRSYSQDRRARARENRRLRNAARSRMKYRNPYTFDQLAYSPPRRARSAPPRRQRPARAYSRHDRDRYSRKYDRYHRPIRADTVDSCPDDRTHLSDYEHQYGDDTMNFVLDTKDHTRNFLSRAKERGKKALSHFTPSHVHDRADQFIHDERPEPSEDHIELHENHGYLK